MKTDSLKLVDMPALDIALATLFMYAVVAWLFRRAYVKSVR